MLLLRARRCRLLQEPLDELGPYPSPAPLGRRDEGAQLEEPAGLELGEIICVPGLEETGTFEQLRDIQQATLFGGNSGKLAAPPTPTPRARKDSQTVCVQGGGAPGAASAVSRTTIT